jgi:hypothetical protein
METLTRILLLWLVIATCSAAEPQVANLETEAPKLVVPKFECDLPAFKTSGDATNEVRQLQKLERRYLGCVKSYKAKLRQQRDTIIAIQKKTTDPTETGHIQTALPLIDQILASDFKPKQNAPGPDRRDFVDPHHGG